MPADMSNMKTARRDKIIRVAEDLFSRQGFRATTMEGVAAAVGMSKATVYAYFRDKDDLFEGVAHALAQRMRDVVDQALNGDCPLEDRLIDALVAKHELIFRLVRASAFSGELFAAKDQFAAVIFKDLDHEIETMLATTLKQGGVPHAKSKSIARLLFGGSTGVANHARDGAEMAKDIETLVRSVARKQTRSET